MFLEKPITGYGPKMFREICSDEKFYKNAESCTTHPHNTYLQLLSETGLIGTLVVLFLFFVAVYMFLRQIFSIFASNKTRYLQDYQVCLLAMVIIILWPTAVNEFLQ